MLAASPYASRSGYRLAANLHAGIPGYQATRLSGYQAFRARCQVFRRMLQVGVRKRRILDEKRHSAGSGSAPRLVFCCCARDVVAFFTKDGIEWEKPGCVAMKSSVKVIVALLNCRAANLRADSRIAFRLLQAKSPMTAGHRALVLKGGGEKEGNVLLGLRVSAPLRNCSVGDLPCATRELPCWKTILFRKGAVSPEFLPASPESAWSASGSGGSASATWPGGLPPPCRSAGRPPKRGARRRPCSASCSRARRSRRCGRPRRG